MRSLLFLSLVLLTNLSLRAQGDAVGISFSQAPFSELLAQAKAEDKLIFIDAYTTWCGPCKMMSAKVFPQERVGEVYNERFINAKIDMEKGEGPQIARRYSVMAYPTYLFVDGDGAIVHKGMGFIPADALIALADVATGPESLGALNARYDAGERDDAFVGDYLKSLNELYEHQRVEMVLEDYLSGKEDWSDDATIRLLIDNPGPVGEKRFNYLLANADRAIELSGSGTFMMNMQRVLLTDYMRQKGKRQLPVTTEIVPYYARTAAPLKDRLVAHYTMFQAEQMRDTEAYLKATAAYLNAYPSNDFGELNTAAWNFYEMTDDPALLEQALAWAQQSVAISKNYPNLDTLAWLYQRLGRTEEAKRTAREAIEMAKATNQDYSDTERILE